MNKQDMKWNVSEKNDKWSFLEFVQSITSSAWLEDQKNVVYIMDNAKNHHAIVCKQYLKEQGISIMFLPPSSSELNPIGKCCNSMNLY